MEWHTSPTAQSARYQPNIEPFRRMKKLIIRIGRIQSLGISKEDLESLDKKVVVKDIEQLKLGPGMDSEAVNQYIGIIGKVQELAVPKSIFMLILTKSKRLRGSQEILKITRGLRVNGKDFERPLLISQ